MSITINTINEATGKVILSRTFTNSMDANYERDILDKCGIVYQVIWDCR